MGTFCGGEQRKKAFSGGPDTLLPSSALDSGGPDSVSPNPGRGPRPLHSCLKNA